MGLTVSTEIKNIEDFKFKLLSDLRDSPIDDFLFYCTSLNCPVDSQVYYYGLADDLQKQGFINVNTAKTKSGEVLTAYETRKATITIRGLDYLAQCEMNKMVEKQIILNGDTNKSVIETNAATNRNFDNQKKLTQVALILSALSALFVLASVYVTYTDKTSQELQEISKQLQTQGQSLKNMQQYQQGIDSSLKIIAKDSSLIH